MTKVEEVAKAMAEAEGWRWDDDQHMLDCAAAGWQKTGRERLTWRLRARAAIRALREPTADMIAAGHTIRREEAWPAMIVILAEHEASHSRASALEELAQLDADMILRTPGA